LIKIKELATEIENTAFTLLFSSSDKGMKYLNRAKAIASNLQDKKNTEFRNTVLEGRLNAKELSLMDVKSMASADLQSKRLMMEKDAFNSMRSDWNDLHTPVGIGMYTCENCKGQRTTSKEIQLRGADEPMTIFIRCVECGNEWRIG
jgi:transcription elongation factor S-II